MNLISQLKDIYITEMWLNTLTSAKCFPNTRSVANSKRKLDKRIWLAYHINKNDRYDNVNLCAVSYQQLTNSCLGLKIKNRN